MPIQHTTNCQRLSLCLQQVIPGGKNTSVEAIAWAHQTVLTEDEDFWDSEKEKQAAIKKLTKTPPRLFSAGLNAVVTEWDLTSLKPKVCSTHTVYGESEQYPVSKYTGT